MEQSQKSRANVYGMVITALFTALTVVCAQISIPIGPVPINLALLAVFFQLSSPIEEVQQRAYAAALILTIIVLILSLLGRFITNRFSKNKVQ